MRGLAAIAVIAFAVTGCSPGNGLKQEAETAARRELRDPDSAQFRYQYEDMEVFPDAGVLCGELNARNGYGGLTGFKGYAYVRGQGVAFEASDATPTADAERYVSFLGACTRLLQQRTGEMTQGGNASAPPANGQ